MAQRDPREAFGALGAQGASGVLLQRGLRGGAVAAQPAARLRGAGATM